MSIKETKNFKEILNEGRFMDYTIMYLLGKRLLTPLKDWKAYKLGLIDLKGKTIKRPKTSQEKDALTLLDRFLLFLKSLLTAKNLLLLGAFLLLKESDGDRVIKAIGDKELVERLNENQKIETVISNFRKDLSENFKDEDEFWERFLRSK